MTAEQFKNALDAQPFRPFVAHLTDGRQIRVERRELALVSPRGRTAVIFQPDDSSNIIDLSFVADLQFRPDGTPKRRRR